MFDNITLPLDNSITVIYGKNGSGKSLLARALCEILWRNSAGNSHHPDLWSNLYLDTLFLKTGNQKYRIVSSEDSYYLEQLSFEEVNNNEMTVPSDEQESPIYNDQAANRNEMSDDRYIIDGIDRETYITAVFIPSPNDIGTNEFVDYESLKNILLNDSSRYYQLYKELRPTGHTAGGPGNRLMSEILKQEGALKELKKKVQIHDIQSTRLSKMKKEKNQIETDISKLKKQLTSASKNMEMLGKMLHDITTINELTEEIKWTEEELQCEKKKIVEMSQIKKEMKKMFPTFYNLSIDEIPSLDTIQENFIELRNINEKIDTIVHSKEIRMSRIKKFALTGNVAAFTALLTLLYKNGFDLSVDTLLLIGISSLIFFFNLILLILGLTSRKTGEIDELNTSIAQYEDAIKDILVKSKVDFDGNRLGELYEFLLQYFEEYTEFSDRNRDLANIKKSLKERNYIRNIESKLKKLRDTEKKIKGELKNAGFVTGIPGESVTNGKLIKKKIEEMQNDIESFTNQIQAKETLLLQVTSEIGQNRENSGGNNSLQEEIKMIEKSVLQLQTRKNTMDYVFDILQNAIKKREDARLRRIISEALENFNYITGNQYITRVGAHTLEKMILQNDNSDDFNPALHHALLLSLKLSMTDIIAESSEPLPLICDDPFLFMDDERISRTKQMFNIISEKRQVIIFTHVKSINDWGTYLHL